MITLITGGPGTGKTAWLLDQLLTLRKVEPNKLLFVHGVRNLRGISHETIYCRSQLCDICRSADIPQAAKFVEEWPVWKESNSLVIVDEVQRIWRPRSGGAAPSDAVSGLETHRHYGLDFWLISQGPHLFDNFIRLLVGRHVHLVSRWSGRTQYEWPECKQDVQSRGDAVTRPYKLPAHVYKHYDSAEVHTKQDKRKPISFYVTIAAILLAIFAAGFVYTRLKARITPIAPVPASQTGVDGLPSSPVQAASVPVAKPVFPDFKPTVPNVPESAPAYSELVKVTVAPVLSGCISTPKVCKCYTQQGTPYPTTKEFCSSYIAGNYFNPYKMEREGKNYASDKSELLAQNETKHN